MHSILALEYTKLEAQRRLEDAERERLARQVRRARGTRRASTAIRSALRTLRRRLASRGAAPVPVHRPSPSPIPAQAAPTSPALPRAPWEEPETERVGRQLLLTAGRH